MASDDEDEKLADFLESGLLSEISDQDESETVEDERGEGRKDCKRCRADDCVLCENEQETKKVRIEACEISDEGLSTGLRSCSSLKLEAEAEASFSLSKRDINNYGSRHVPRSIDTGNFSQIPPELLYNILKFLSSEDLVSCSLACRFFNFIAADESLWRRLYCMRWGLLAPKKPRECAWKKLYIQRDEDDMIEFVRNCPSEFKEYFIQMQVAKRSQAPHPSQVNDDCIILDKTLADQVSTWKSNRGLTDAVVVNHACSGETCTYYQIADVFVCEKTGNVHVCDDTCKEVIMDPSDDLLVCTISGRCFDRLLSPAEIEPDGEQQQGGVADEAEPFMGSGRFARAYLLGYNCEDEKELEATLRFC